MTSVNRPHVWVLMNESGYWAGLATTKPEDKPTNGEWVEYVPASDLIAPRDQTMEEVVVEAPAKPGHTGLYAADPRTMQPLHPIDADGRDISHFVDDDPEPRTADPLDVPVPGDETEG